MSSHPSDDLKTLDKIIESVERFEPEQHHDWSDMSLFEKQIVASRLLESHQHLCDVVGLSLVADPEKTDGPPAHLVVTDRKAIARLVEDLVNLSTDEEMDALLHALLRVTIFEKIDPYLEQGVSAVDIDELIDSTVLLESIDRSLFSTGTDVSHKINRYLQYVWCQCIVEYSQYEKDMRRSLDKVESGDAGLIVLESLWLRVKEWAIILDGKAGERNRIIHLIEYILSDFGEVISTGVNKYTRYLDTGFYRYKDHDKEAARKEIASLYVGHNLLIFQMKELRNKLLGNSRARGYNFYDNSLLE